MKLMYQDLVDQSHLFYRSSVWRSAISILAIGSVPMTLSIAAAVIVARLSVITTESVNSPDCLPLRSG